MACAILATRVVFLERMCACACGVDTHCSGIIIKKYRSRKKMVVVAPWDAALQSLSMLQQEKVATIEQGGNLYAAITRILKNYVHQRYGFDIASKTDDELVVF